MSNQIDDSGEWTLEDWIGMAERLKTFWPVNPVTGERIGQGEWAELMGINPSSFSDIIKGRAIAMKTHQKIIFWLVKSGYSAADVLWWQSGWRENPQKRLRIKLVPRGAMRKIAPKTEEPPQKLPSPHPRGGKRRGGRVAFHEK